MDHEPGSLVRPRTGTRPDEPVVNCYSRAPSEEVLLLKEPARREKQLELTAESFQLQMGKREFTDFSGSS